MKTITSIKTGNVSEERREFIRKSGAVAAMSLFGLSFFTSCSSDDRDPGTPPSQPSNSNGITISDSSVVIDLDEETSLATAGSWMLIIQARVLVFNLGNNQFSALTSVCTHTGCDRNWTFSNNLLTCTCHGSRFTTDGTVNRGPANRPLRSFPSQLNGSRLTINLS